MPRPQRQAAANVKYTVDPPTDEEGDEEARVVKAGVRKGKRRASGAADDGEDIAEPPKKRGRAGAGGGGRRRAKLESFQAMPMDVLVEIARHLDPLTLLHMSRANKMMRHAFARRASKPIWQIVRSNVGIPALEATDMTDMQLTALLFDKECRICGRGRAIITDYCLRMRWCKDCKKANLASDQKLVKELKGKYNMHPKLLECSLYTFDSPSGYNIRERPYYCKAAILETNERLKDLQKAVSDARRKPVPIKDAAKAALEAFIAEKSAIAKASHKDGQMLRDWESSFAERRKEADERVRQERCAAIESRVRALGYEEADCKARNWPDVQRLVDQPTRLTDAIWESISDRIIAAVDVNRRMRILHDAEEKLHKRYSQFPATVDKALKDAIAAEVEKAKLITKLGFASSLARAYEVQGVAMDDKLAARLKALPPTHVPADLKITTEYGESELSRHGTWWAPKEALNFEAFDDSISDLEADIDALLRRFTSLFRCTSQYPNQCGKPHPYRQFLKHAATHNIGMEFGPVVCDDFQHFGLLHQVLEETGLPNLIGSIETLEKSDWRFECRACKSPPHYAGRDWVGGKVMTWPAFINHISRDHKADVPPDMRAWRKGERQPQASSSSLATRG